MFQRREADALAASTKDLKVFEIFETLSSEGRSRWRSICKTRQLQSGELLYREGEPVEAIFVLEHGDVALFREAIGFPVQLLGRCKKGDILGHIALFAEVLHMESARCSGVCRVLEVSRDDFTAFLIDHPDLHQELEHTATEQYGARLAAGLELGKHREVRMRLSRPVAIRLADGQEREVTLENLSLGGFCMVGAPEQWELGEEVTFALRFPEASLDLAGRVAWRAGDNVGLAFHHTSEQHDAMIQMATHLLLDA